MQATIASYTVEKGEKGEDKSFVAYNVHCKMDGVEWTLLRRYSEFHQLQKALLKSTTPSAQRALASFPPKLMFGNKKDEKIAKRKFNLQVWLDSVLTNDEMYEHKDVHHFLETKKHVGYNPTLSNKQSTTGTTTTTQVLPPQPTTKQMTATTTTTTLPATTTTTTAASVLLQQQQQPSSKQQQLVKALYAYKKNDESEIAFDKGDILQVIQKDDSGWWYGRVYNAANEQKSSADLNQLNGFFPMNYVTSLSDSDTAMMNGQTATAKPVIKKRALYDYEADPASLTTTMKELSLKAGVIVKVLESGPQNNGWCYVQKEENQVLSEGWVPEDYLGDENA